MRELFAYLQTAIPHFSSGEIKHGEGWVAARIWVDRPDENRPGQYLQVSVGGDILDVYLESARATLEEDVLRDKDMMVTTIQSGFVDQDLNEKLLAYALGEWHGIPWDEASGFSRPE